MQEAHGDTNRPDDETPEEPRIELRLSGEDDSDASATPEASADPSADAVSEEPVSAEPEPAAPTEVPATEPLDLASTGPVSIDAGPEPIVLDGGPEASEPAPAPSLDLDLAGGAPSEPAPEPDPAPVTEPGFAADAPDLAPASEPAPAFEIDDERDLVAEVDEVLVFQMDEEDDLGPSLPEGFEEGDEATTYSELSDPGAAAQADEFSELGETWEARLSGEEPEAFEDEQPDRRRQVALAAGAGAVVALLVFALGGGDDQTVEEGGANVEVARNGSNDRAPRTGSGGDSARNDAATNANGAGRPTEREPREPRAPRSMVAGLSELFAPMAGSVDGGAVATGGDPDALASLFGGDRSRERREGFIPVEEQVVLPGPLPNLEMADASDFAHIWMQPGLPPDGALHADYLQTPLFGSARVHTSAQEFFDGRLVGVGAGRVSLDTGAGELILDADQVAGIERLVEGEYSSDSLVARTTGERVRVRAAGGWLRGEVVREDTDTVTLLLESGGRITVDRSVVRPASGAGRPRLAEPPIAG